MHALTETVLALPGSCFGVKMHGTRFLSHAPERVIDFSLTCRGLSVSPVF